MREAKSAPRLTDSPLLVERVNSVGMAVGERDEMEATEPFLNAIEYKCNECGHLHSKQMGPVQCTCPECGSLYSEWLNFDEFVAANEAAIARGDMQPFAKSVPVLR